MSCSRGSLAGSNANRPAASVRATGSIIHPGCDSPAKIAASRTGWPSGVSTRPRIGPWPSSFFLGSASCFVCGSEAGARGFGPPPSPSEAQAARPAIAAAARTEII